MEKACIGFRFSDALEAYEHMRGAGKLVEDYGHSAYGHPLYTWDDGGRCLVRCGKCGGYILIQSSEFHSFSDNSDDSYYTDFFPVSSPEEAEDLNIKYDGFSIETEFRDRYLMETNGHVCWSK